MTPLTALWLPILLSAVLIFIVSSIIHMFTKWHAGDYRSAPDEAALRSALLPLAIPPGDYMIPRPQSMEEMRSPEFAEKMKSGPVMMFTMMPSGHMGMGKQLTLWFLYGIVVAWFAAYIAGRALAPGVEYLEVFRFVGATMFIGYTVALWQMSIWYHRSWATTFRNTVDGLIYALLSAGIFGWLWP